MRRSNISKVIFFILLILSSMVTVAQEDIPNVVVSVSDSGVKFSSEIPAGFVNLTFENNLAKNDYKPLIARLNDGVSMKELLAAQESGDEMQMLPLLTLYGGIHTVESGESSSYTTKLISGDYALFNTCEDNCDAEKPIGFTVVESDGTEQTPPKSDVTLALVDFAFGVPAQIPSGPLVWHIENIGEQWHHVLILPVDDGKSALDVRNELMSGKETSLPIWSWLPSDPGTQSWVTIELEPGTYAVICFLPDLHSDFSPHLAHGMVQTFVVE
ncbi:MAG: hypothetical protein R3E39_25960 [Anaerolineae bacterium]